MTISLRITVVCLASIAASALVSCGGNTRDGSEASSGGTSAGEGGAGRGGASGAVGTGAGGSGNPSGGAGGEPALCSLPAVIGSCTAAFQRFFHNPASGVCESFLYGGCGGNENNFETFEECQAACGSKALDLCEDNADCVLRAKGCCGACEPSKVADFIAINVESDAAYDAIRGCNGIACGPCPEPDPATSVRGYFVATCQANRCIAVDLRTTDVTECEAPSDCSLRIGSSCCEGCGGGDVIAVSNRAALSKLVCSEERTPCPECVPVEPGGVVADCQANRCVVEELLP